jgi:uncharacterized protein DUF551
VVDDIQWISVKDRLPDPFTDVWVKTSYCDKCPISKGMYFKDGCFVYGAIALCEVHLEQIQADRRHALENWSKRITDWAEI